MTDRQTVSQSLKSRAISAIQAIRVKEIKKRKKSSVLSRLSKSSIRISPIEDLHFENTGEYDFLREHKRNWHLFSIEGKNTINKQYDLMIGVPVYNGEEYIESCINSLLSQKTEYSYEIVIVDDGSTDHTPGILENYKSLSHVRVIRQENCGLSSARNRVLKDITGRYVFFIDADDELKDNAIQVLLKTAFDNDADIVEGSYTRFNEQGEFDAHIHNNDNSIVNQEIPLFGFPWGKAIRAELFKSIVFPEGYIFEDSIFAYCIHPLSSTKFTLSDICYKYRYNTEGICATANKSDVSIDTFFVSFFLWRYYINHFQLSKRFFETFVGQSILNYYRTQSLDENVQKAAFALTQKIYVTVFREPLVTDNKHTIFDKCMRYGSFEVFCDLVSVWDDWE